MVRIDEKTGRTEQGLVAGQQKNRPQDVWKPAVPSYVRLGKHKLPDAKVRLLALDLLGDGLDGQNVNRHHSVVPVWMGGSLARLLECVNSEVRIWSAQVTLALLPCAPVPARPLLPHPKAEFVHSRPAFADGHHASRNRLGSGRSSGLNPSPSTSVLGLSTMKAWGSTWLTRARSWLASRRLITVNSRVRGTPV